MPQTKPTLTKVHQWNRLTTDALHYTNASPNVAARALAMVHTAMYDAWTNFNDGGNEVSTTTGSQFKQPHAKKIRANREQAYSYAAYRVLSRLFCVGLPPEKKHIFNDFMCQLGYDPDDKSINTHTAIGLGNLSARLVLEKRAGDKANSKATLSTGKYADWTGYAPINPPLPSPMKDSDRWQPQLDDNNQPQQFLTPHWGLVQPFALNWGGQYRPPCPAVVGSKEFRIQAQEVLKYSSNLSDEQKVIAEFWGGMHEDRFVDTPKDGDYRRATPPEQWSRIARYLSKTRGYRSSMDIKMFFVLSNALLDAGIAAWDAKVHYDYVRPISAIRHLFKGQEIEAWGGVEQGTQKIQGENWIPYIPTPPFAEYVSGHSAFSAAAAEVLTAFSNGDCSYNESVVIAKGTSRIEYEHTPCEDVCLSWATLEDAANQAGISRLYGGIHFKSGDLEGRKLGLQIGCDVWEKAVLYFNGDLG